MTAYRLCPTEGPDSPWPIFERVLTYPELSTQSDLFGLDITWAFVFRIDEDGWIKGERQILGTAQMPRVTGALAGLFDQLLEDALGYRPDFLIVLNGVWWEEASDLEREILVFHELKHCSQAMDAFGSPKFNRQTGAPILTMRAHDVEEFNDVVARYGAWKGDLVAFRDAMDAGPPRPPNSPVMPPLEDVMEALAEDVAAQLDRDATPHGESPADVF